MSQIASFYGIPLSRHGKARCPFHSEKTASFSVKGHRWKCFGCGEGGDAIDFVMKLFSLTFPQAVDRISYDFGLGIERSKPDPAALARIRTERAERDRVKEVQAQRVRSLCAIRRALWADLRDNEPYQTADGTVIWPDAWVLAAHRIDYLDYLIDGSG